MFNPYLGRTYGADDIRTALEAVRDQISWQEYEDPLPRVADLLAAGEIVAIFQDGAELGPRALGHRSILVDPRRKEMKDILNARVKHREAFRPFAPIVPWEYQREYFELDIISPFMLFVAPTRPEKREVIPAVVHVDGTARVQTVLRELSPELHRLLMLFRERTGVPVLLNTSFNVNKEPIVETPAQALACFLGTRMDYVLLSRFLVARKPAAELHVQTGEERA